MSRDPANECKRMRIRIDLNPKELEMLQRLVATGLYGLTVGDACHRIVDEHLHVCVTKLNRDGLGTLCQRCGGYHRPDNGCYNVEEC